MVNMKNMEIRNFSRNVRKKKKSLEISTRTAGLQPSAVKKEKLFQIKISCMIHVTFFYLQQFLILARQKLQTELNDCLMIIYLVAWALYLFYHLLVNCHVNLECCQITLTRYLYNSSIFHPFYHGCSFGIKL